MDRMIYTAMSGATQTMARQAVVANNLANVSTTGFKAQLSMARAVPVNGDGLPTRISAAETTPGADLTAGTIEHTGRSLDVAIDGKGWLAVQDPAGGEAYTRDGKLEIDATGVLRSGGHVVLGQGGRPLVMPLGAEVTIAQDGTISVLGAGDQPDQITEVGQLKLVDPADEAIVRGEDGLFRQRPQAGNAGPGMFPADPNVRVVSGAIEGSNVNPTDAMVAMIDNARHYAMQMKAVSTADENAQRANSLLSLS